MTPLAAKYSVMPARKTAAQAHDWPPARYTVFSVIDARMQDADTASGFHL